MPITVSGTQITFNDGTNQTTAFTGGGGTVTSVATGNGLQGGTITTSGTLSIACPTFNTVGSYAGVRAANQGSYASGSNYAAGNIQTIPTMQNTQSGTNNLSGTWKWMGAPLFFGPCDQPPANIACRVS